MVVATLAYDKADGQRIQIQFTGSDSRTVKMDAAYARIQNRLRKVDTYLSEQHTVSTFVMSEEMRLQCKALAKSDEPMALINGEWKDITILEVDFSDTIPWTRPYAFKITYIVQDDDAKAFGGEEEN